MSEDWVRQLDARQRAMLAEMGVKVWAPKARATAVADVEDPGDEEPGAGHERTPRLDGQPPRPAIGWDGVEEGRQLPPQQRDGDVAVAAAKEDEQKNNERSASEGAAGRPPATPSPSPPPRPTL